MTNRRNTTNATIEARAISALKPYHCMLPKRLRGMEQCLQRLRDNRLRGDHFWEDDLRQRCEARSLDFAVLSDRRLMRTWPIKDLGMKFVDGLPVPATAKTRRQLQRLIDAEHK